MRKYDALKPFFESLTGNEVTLTFADIETVLGFKLPSSAHEHNSWWANSKTASHWWTHHWMRAGWERTSLDLEGKRVSFERKGSGPTALAPFEGSRYWWVNHKQTHRAEIEGGYIWSPQKKQNGAANKSYDNLRLVRAGDLIFSYASGAIRAIGTATGTYREEMKPPEFGVNGNGWHPEGWRVPIDWAVLDRPVIPKDHLAEIQAELPDSHSPLQSNGNGNQGIYLASISVELANLIIEISGVEASEVSDRQNESIRDAADDAEMQAIAADQKLEPTYKEQLVKARRGQGRFRAGVARVECRCRLTGVDDQRFLVASHIKPWSECTNQEKLDPENGLFLAPHADKLFDRGWISFQNDGELLVADEHAQLVANAWGLLVSYSQRPFSEKQSVYLAFHREFVFARSAKRRPPFDWTGSLER